MYLFLKAAETFPEESDRYLGIARKCAECTWDRGLLKKGYGLCHGAAGNGYSLLAFYKATGDLTYLQRGLRYAEWCCDRGKHPEVTIPDDPYSLMNGLAGTVYFLNDVLHGIYEFPCFSLK